MASDKVYKTVFGEAFKIRRPDSGDDDKTYFTVKSLITNKYISCTLWDNSHGVWLEEHPEFVNGVLVFVNGSVKVKVIDDKQFINMSVGRIGTIAMDAGVDTRTGSDDSEAAAAEEDVI
jgi:hypothetical protein